MTERLPTENVRTTHTPPHAQLEQSEFMQHLQLFLPRYLHPTQELMIRQARALREEGALTRAWPSVRQANWLAEVAARAVTVQDIISHLKSQGPRWKDSDRRPPLHKTIARAIGDQLYADVEQAVQNAAERVNSVLAGGAPADWAPTPDLIGAQQLALARIYIGALVTWRRADESGTII